MTSEYVEVCRCGKFDLGLHIVSQVLAASRLALRHYLGNELAEQEYLVLQYFPLSKESAEDELQTVANIFNADPRCSLNIDCCLSMALFLPYVQQRLTAHGLSVRAIENITNNIQSAIHQVGQLQ